MNSGAKIIELQELDRNKRLLAAQREMYSTAKRYDAANRLVSLVLPVVVTLVQVMVEVPFWITTVVAALMLGLGLFLEQRTSLLVTAGAKAQQLFDEEVYGIRFENVSRDKQSIDKYANRYLKHEGDLSEFGKWYTVPIRELKPGEAILECQRQNSAWTYNLGRRFMICSCIASVLLIAAVVVMIVFSGTSLAALTFLFCIFEWPATMLVRGAKMLKTTHSLPSAMERHKLSHDVESLKWNQENIFEYRSSSLPVPDWFYRRFKDRDNEKSR